MEREFLIHHTWPIQNTENIHPESHLSYQRTLSDEHIQQTHALMAPSFVSRGGDIRDIDISELTDIARNKGELWTASDNQIVYAACTLLPITGNITQWEYLNHGIVAPQERYKGGKIMETLLRSCLKQPRNIQAYFTISTAQSIFTRLGFIDTDITSLACIDKTIAEITNQKLRPGTNASIFIKIV